MAKHIPNLLTISNLISGCIALYFTFQGELVYTAYLIGLATVFDFMDGAVARLLNVSNPIGKELDSLADMVSFGLVPGFLVFHLLKEGTLSQYSFIALLIPKILKIKSLIIKLRLELTQIRVGLLMIQLSFIQKLNRLS